MIKKNTIVCLPYLEANGEAIFVNFCCLFKKFLHGGKVHDLARVTKKIHIYFKAFISTP